MMDGACFFMELFIIRTADIILMYIPSKYDFVSEGENTYKMKYIDMKDADTLADEYTGGNGMNDMQLQATYSGVAGQPTDGKMEERLENGYKHLKDTSDADMTVLKAIVRQMKRLKYCVSELKYKLATFYKNYICVIRRDDSIDCMVVKNYPYEEGKKLTVVIDLEMVYEQNENITESVQRIRESIYNVLEKNQGMHTRVMTKIIENHNEMQAITGQINVKSSEYDEMISKLEKMLQTMIKAEEGALLKLKENEKSSGTNLQSDITRVHTKSSLEKELDRIIFLKTEIAKKIIEVRGKRENVILSIDKIMFDNAVMFDCMIANFAKLKEFFVE